MFKIIAVSEQGREEIDEFDDIDEARQMCIEYQIAYGSSFEILVLAPLFSERARTVMNSVQDGVDRIGVYERLIEVSTALSNHERAAEV